MEGGTRREEGRCTWMEVGMLSEGGRLMLSWCLRWLLKVVGVDRTQGEDK